MLNMTTRDEFYHLLGRLTFAKNFQSIFSDIETAKISAIPDEQSGRSRLQVEI